MPKFIARKPEKEVISMRIPVDLLHTVDKKAARNLAREGIATEQAIQLKGSVIMKKRICIVLFMVCVTLLFAAGCSGKQPAEKAQEETGPEIQESEGASSRENPAESSYTAVIEVEGYGAITLALDASAAPLTTENFVKLAREGFYDGLTFHRIIEGFMIQGGDPNGNGTGGSEQTIKGEFSQNGVENNLSHTRGAISMARSEDCDSASSQFFIVHEDSTFLDGAYAAFGYVTEGMEVVDAICADAQPIDGNGLIAPEVQPVIQSVTIQ